MEYLFNWSGRIYVKGKPNLFFLNGRWWYIAELGMCQGEHIIEARKWVRTKLTN